MFAIYPGFNARRHHGVNENRSWNVTPGNS
jgi:hypothetical protein